MVKLPVLEVTRGSKLRHTGVLAERGTTVYRGIDPREEVLAVKFFAISMVILQPNDYSSSLICLHKYAQSLTQEWYSYPCDAYPQQ